MPHYFPNTIRAILKGRTVRMAHLAEFMFRDAPAYVWNGVRTITTGGHDWIGFGKLGSITGIDETSSETASTIKASLSGVDSAVLAVAASEDRADYVGFLLRVWMQFFDEDWSLLDAPYARAAGIMDGMEITRSPGVNGVTLRTVSVTAPNIFYGRRIPPFGYWTDRDQQKRYPGDIGLSFVTSLQNAELPYPWSVSVG